MRWDALQLNENGVANDGSNFVPDGSSNAVKAAEKDLAEMKALNVEHQKQVDALKPSLQSCQCVMGYGSMSLKV